MHRFLAVLAVLLQAGHVLAADCAGGPSARCASRRPGRLHRHRDTGGADPPAAVAGGLELILEDARDGAIVYAPRCRPSASSPAGRARSTTRQGVLRERPARRHPPAGRHGTGRRSATPRTFTTDSERSPAARPADLGGGCARTCVADCARRGGRPAVPPEPRLRTVRRRRLRRARRGGRAGEHVAYCGLSIDTTPACDFLIDERCILPFPSSLFLDDDPIDADRASASTTRRTPCPRTSAANTSTRPTGTRSTASARGR